MTDKAVSAVATATPTSADTVLGLQSGLVKRFAVAPPYSQLAAVTGAGLLGYDAAQVYSAGTIGKALSNLALPASATDPTTRVDGSALQAGDQYFNTVSLLTLRYSGSAWIASDINTALLAATTGAGLVGHSSGNTYSAGTVGKAIANIVSGATPHTSLESGFLRTTGYSTTSENVNFASAASSYNTQWIYGRLFGFGTIAAGGTVDSFNSIVAIDQANAQAVPFLSGFNVTYRAAVGAVGGRIAVHSDMGITGAVTAGSGTPDFVSSGSHAFASANAGGNGTFVTTPDDGYVGGLFGGNDHPRLASGGTYWRFLAGREIDVEIESGASAFARVGLFIVTGTNAASQAFGDDVGIGFSNKSGTTVPWKHGIKFGMTWGVWPFDATSTLIGAQMRAYPTSAPETVVNANYGIDFSTVTFATAAFKSPGFTVNGSGAIASSGITSTGGGVGYATGAGGTVTQATSKSTGVTLNKTCGQITMNNAALAAGAKVSFVVTNSTVAATDSFAVCVASGGTASAYRAGVTAAASGSFTVTVENITAGSLAEAPVITFAVIKAVNS